MATKAKASEEMVIEELLSVERGEFTVHILGMTPLVLNRMSEKTMRELLLPRGKKNAAEKASTAKHDPLTEYQASPYIMPHDAQTYIGGLASWFKQAICTAALDMPGARKAQIGRLVYVTGNLVGIYGVPKLFMSIVRSADMNRTPDVRTRAIIPEWACELRITYAQPLLNQKVIMSLLTTSGLTSGVGDWRPQKGKGDYGQFFVASSSDHDEWERRVSTGGRVAQELAMANPECYDIETEELMTWYGDEFKRRGFGERRNGVAAQAVLA